MKSEPLFLLAPVRRWLLWAALLGLALNLLVLATPIYMLQIFDRVLVSQSLPTLAMLTLITVILVAGHAALDILRARLLLRAGVGLEQALGPETLSRLHDVDPRSPGAATRADLMRDLMTLRNYLSSPHLTALFDAPWVPIFTLLIFAFSWVLGVTTLIGMAVLVVLAWLEDRLTRPGYTVAHTASQQSHRLAQTALENADAVRVMGMKANVITRWRAAANEALTALKSASDRGSTIAGLTKAARTLLQVAMLGVGAYLVVGDHLPPGIMIASTIIVARAVSPVESAVTGWRQFVEVRNAYARLAKLLILEPAEPQLELPPLKGGLVLENVTIGFEAGAPLVTNLNLQLQPGDALGIIGPSGSGKSTLARVIAGALRPAHGRVLLDGHDARHYIPFQLGRQIGYVPQDIELFPGSIADNICRLGNGTDHDAEIVRVGEWLKLARIVARLPRGYATPLSDQGLNLSGGQRQWIALARAFFGRPALVVLDEPDAHLDRQGEADLLALIDEIRASRTATLVIATHNPQLVNRMDRLVLLEDGRAKLLERNANTATALPRERVA